jgi:hypothetical protein
MIPHFEESRYRGHTGNYENRGYKNPGGHPEYYVLRVVRRPAPACPMKRSTPADVYNLYLFPHFPPESKKGGHRKGVFRPLGQT